MIVLLEDEDGREIVRPRIDGPAIVLPGPARPLSFSTLLPAGRLPSACPVLLRVAPGVVAPVQAETLTSWPDGSVQWLRLEMIQPSGEPADEIRIRLSTTEGIEYPRPTVRVAQEKACISADTGTARFMMDPRAAFPLREIIIEERSMLDGATTPHLSLATIQGKPAPIEATGHSLESCGPVRATLRVDGRVHGNAHVRTTCRLSVYAGCSFVRVEITLHNANAATHSGGLWDLGDPGSFRFSDFSLELPLQARSDARFHLAVTASELPSGNFDCVDLYQGSSGGETWNSPTHLNAAGQVPINLQGYRLEKGKLTVSGSRATPTLVRATGDGAVALHFPEFWQNFPKSVSGSSGGIRVGLFPREFGDAFELQAGEMKTHEFWLYFGASSELPAHHIATLRSIAIPTPAARPVLEHSGPVVDGTDVTVRERPQLDRLLAAALDGPDSLFVNRERVDEYGWRNWGEIVADHERQHYDGPLPMVSHYNNQFDMVYGFLLNFLRTGDLRLFELGDALARHVCDIDIYHTDKDRAAYSGGMFWHTDHYKSAQTATHRGYSRRNKLPGSDYGGGPSCEHNYTTGLYLHHCLTGSPQSRAAVVSLADWVIRMDDGELTPWRFLDSSPTGKASATRQEDYHGPGRGAGNSINALLDAWCLTREHRYVAHAETLVSRCIHPDDDIEALGLLEVEERWSYTVFLTALLKYLRMKAVTHAGDEMFQYARASLVRYAGWMSDNERPYFDQPHKLEYPTETWAAQDLRKANVLRASAAYVDEPLRTRYFSAGSRLAQRAWQDLECFETRACARPLAILMVEALKEIHCPPATVSITAELPDIKFAPRTLFVPQKQRIKAMLTSPSAAFMGVVHLVRHGFYRFLSRGPRSGIRS